MKLLTNILTPILRVLFASLMGALAAHLTPQVWTLVNDIILQIGGTEALVTSIVGLLAAALLSVWLKVTSKIHLRTALLLPKGATIQDVKNNSPSVTAAILNPQLMKVLLLSSALFLAGCTTTQMDHARKVLSTPQAKSLESAGALIAQAALTAYAPEFAWTIPLALNAASGLLEAKTTAETVATVQQTVQKVANIPQYHDVATQIGNAIAVVKPVDEAQRIAATQVLAKAIADNLPK